MTSPVFSVKTLLPVCFLLATITCFVCVPDSNGNDDHNANHKRHGKGPLSSLGHDRGDKGNEFTGQCAAWIFAAANLSVSLSLIFKGVIRFASLARETKDKITFFNKLQKKYLMRFHYVLNPLAVVLALLHFSLSCCRSTSFPEWGLTGASTLALIGLIIKFRGSPPRIRKFVYRIHTSPVPFGLILVLLLAGHGIID